MSKYQKNEVIEGVVTGIEDYGIFIGLDEYYSGLIHISEISDGFVRNVNYYVKVGETIKARVLEVDDDNCHVKLSIKNLNYRARRSRRTKINEVGSGFEILKNNLDNWIEEKIAISKN